MSLHRRSFLGGLAGILAYAQAPAMVRDPMRLRAWSWEPNESGLLVRRRREEPHIDIAPRLLMVSASGLVLSDSPLQVHEAQGGRIRMTGGIVHRSGTVASARVVKPGVCDMAVTGLAGVAVCTSNDITVDISMAMPAFAMSVPAFAMAVPASGVRFSEQTTQDMARVLVEELRK